jgi:glycosyltransferase involved in cell wall biosynthesis
MKVLIISDAWHPQVNGVVRTYEYLLQELDRCGHESLVIGPCDFPVTMPMPFYPEIRLVLSPYRRLQKMIEEYAPDKIHIATEGPLGWAARRYCLKHKSPFTTSYHTQFPDYMAKRFAWLIPPLYKAVHRAGVRSVRRFHAPSEAIMISTDSLREQLENWNFKTPMAHLTRGVDLTYFTPGKKSVLQDLKAPIALYVGRIAIEKNLEAFLDMDWHGSKVMVGDGPVRKSLEARYPDVHFVGKKTGHKLAEYYRSSDVFVFPSKTDTFGIVLIEALACGLPVAAYNVTGPKDVITHEHLGALHEHDLREAALQALKSADSEKASAHVRGNYNWERAAKQFIDAL